MSEQSLAVLRSLALRPALVLAPDLKPIVTALHAKGYVMCGPEGWIATSEGCRLIEQQRCNAAALTPQTGTRR